MNPESFHVKSVVFPHFIRSTAARRAPRVRTWGIHQPLSLGETMADEGSAPRLALYLYTKNVYKGIALFGARLSEINLWIAGSPKGSCRPFWDCRGAGASGIPIQGIPDVARMETWSVF